jgi:dTMP kinase
LRRAQERGQDAETRFEKFEIGFHETLHKAFADLAAKEPERCTLIDGTRDAETVAASVWAKVAERLKP